MSMPTTPASNVIRRAVRYPIRSRGITTIGPWDSRWASTCKITGSSRYPHNQPALGFHAFSRGHRAQEPHAGQRLHAEPDVPARRHLLQLPRCPRQPVIESQLRAPATEICLACHSANGPNGPRTATLEQHTHHKSGTPRRPVRPNNHITQDRSHHSRRQCPRPHLPVHHPGHMTDKYKESQTPAPRAIPTRP